MATGSLNDSSKKIMTTTNSTSTGPQSNSNDHLNYPPSKTIYKNDSYVSKIEFYDPSMFNNRSCNSTEISSNRNITGTRSSSYNHILFAVENFTTSLGKHKRTESFLSDLDILNHGFLATKKSRSYLDSNSSDSNEDVCHYNLDLNNVEDGNNNYSTNAMALQGTIAALQDVLSFESEESSIATDTSRSPESDELGSQCH
jgi:hypothetical protein